MIKISFVGDLMCEKEQLLANKLDNGYDFSSIFTCVKSAFNSSDYLVGNLETPIAGEELGYSSRKWSFNTPIEYVKILQDVGFGLVSTANNHCLDRNVHGVISTLDNLNKIGMDHVGTYKSLKDRQTIFVKDIGGVKIAFMSYTYGTNAAFNKFYLNNDNAYLVNLFRDQERSHKIRFRGHGRIIQYIDKIKSSNLFNPYLKNLDKDIKKAKKQADFIVMLMHSGGQYNLIPDKWTAKLLDHLIDKGVDAVVGCHPHVVQKGIAYPNKKVGLFSLGNFCSYPGRESTGGKDLEAKAEYSIILHLHIDSLTKTMEKVTFQVAKSVVGIDKKANIHLLYDLIEQEQDRDKRLKLIEDNSLIISRFMDLPNGNFDLKEEYEFF